jgi:hypothetical protein
VKRCIKCERLWKELSAAATAYVRLYCEHERLIELRGGPNAQYLSQLAAACERRKTARQALLDHEAGPDVVSWSRHRSSENMVPRTLAEGKRRKA